MHNCSFATFAHEVHPVGFSSLDWKAPQITRVTTSLLDYQSGAMVLSWSGLGRVETIGERSCLVGPYFLFDIDDQWAFDMMKRLLFASNSRAGMAL